MGVCCTSVQTTQTLACSVVRIRRTVVRKMMSVRRQGCIHVSGPTFLPTQRGSACCPPPCPPAPPSPPVVVTRVAVVIGAALLSTSHSGRTSPASPTSSVGPGTLVSTAALIAPAV